MLFIFIHWLTVVPLKTTPATEDQKKWHITGNWDQRNTVKHTQLRCASNRNEGKKTKKTVKQNYKIRRSNGWKFKFQTYAARIKLLISLRHGKYLYSQSSDRSNNYKKKTKTWQWLLKHVNISSSHKLVQQRKNVTYYQYVRGEHNKTQWARWGHIVQSETN